MPGATDLASSTPYGAIAQAGIGTLESVVGLINMGKANKEAKLLSKTRPQYEVDPNAGKELSLTESELGSGGLSANAKQAYDNLNNQQFSSSLDAILRGGGSVNNVSDVFDASEQGKQNLALMNDQLRLSKISNFINSERYNTEQTDKAWQINKFAPYMDKVTANGQARQQAQSMVWSGLGTAGAGAINAPAPHNQNPYANFFSVPKQPAPTQSNFVPYQAGQWSAGGLYGPPDQSLMDTTSEWNG